MGTVVDYGVLSPFRLKTTIDWVNEATNLISSQFWICVGQGSVSWLLNSCLLTVFLHGKEREGEMDHPPVSSSKATSPLTHEDSTPMILLPWKAPPLNAYIEELGLQYMNFRGTNNAFR